MSHPTLYVDGQAADCRSSYRSRRRIGNALRAVVSTALVVVFQGAAQAQTGMFLDVMKTHWQDTFPDTTSADSLRIYIRLLQSRVRSDVSYHDTMETLRTIGHNYWLL